MNITFYKKETKNCISIHPHHSLRTDEVVIWVNTEEGEGGTFPAVEVENVIYEALKKYFDENM